MGLLTVGHDAVRAIGRPTAYLRAMAVHLALLVLGAMLGVEVGGIVGVAWAQVVAAAITLLIVGVLLVRAGVLDRTAVRILRGPLPAAVATVAVHAAAERAHLLPPRSSLPGVLVLGVLLALVFLVVLVAADRAALADLRSALTRADTRTGPR
jgi:PST family polysaccharide transporter